VGTEFGSLSIALSAMQTERQALEVTGQNIANSGTAGYTRQRVDMQAIGGSVQPAMYSTSDGIGDGVQVLTVQRLQDAFLEQQANSANGSLSSLQGSQSTYADLEDAFGEPGSGGLSTSIATFFNSFDDVASNPSGNGVGTSGSSGSRTALLGNAQALADGLNTAANSLASQWSSTQQSMTATVAQINTTAANIASLNQAIVSATAAGNQPNDLMDQRDTLIRSLASSLGVTTKVNANGSTDVLLGGSALVSGNIARQLSVPTSSATALSQVTSTPSVTASVVWSDTGTPAAISGGTVGADLAALNSTIPSYSSQLDAVAASLASSVNAQQAKGTDLTGNLGQPIFGTNNSAATVTASNITVVMTDPNGIAAATAATNSLGQPVVTLDSSGNPVVSLDGSNAQAFANQAGALSNASTAYNTMIVQLGSQSQSVQQQTTTQQSVVTQVEASRDSQSGVDTDEEQTNLITYQQAYNAAAQYTSVINQVLDTLINMISA
jgi:flagellar hook-associated protein 1 FlgK